ncbi:nicotinate mononucleotide-dependent phosphoribosyltransferase CobT [Sulfuricurvum sp.]|uniref:nicotinate mononucleotide-dependent phosphoribosyltransferase CobT n=1 Tax=Sulfuricurvum sp. TaxID=2025608 RepID=UPI0035682C35
MNFTPQDAGLLQSIISARRDVRGNRYINKPIPPEILEAILHAANCAPSVGFSQPWEFIIIDDSSLRQKVYAEFEKENTKAKKIFRDNTLYPTLKLEGITEAEYNIAVLYKKPSKAILGQTTQRKVGEYSVVCAIQNLWLMARAYNIGVGWVSILKPKKIKKILDISSEYKLVAYLTIGYVNEFLDEPELQRLNWESKKQLSDIITTRREKMSIKPILGTSNFAEFLQGKKGTFLLSLSNTKTANIPGITQAGIPGLIHLTPTLDAEFLCTGEVRSLENIATTPKGVPTPGLITRAVHLLHPFSDIGLLDLGLEVKPAITNFPLYDFGISPSGSIAEGANIPAMELFEKGMAFGQEYSTPSDYILLGESVPAGTTTALATALALGYNVHEKFSSSFKNAPDNMKRGVVDQALSRCEGLDDIFDKLAQVSDNMLIFNAGFVLGLQKRNIKTVLAGGTQMAALLLIINSVLHHTKESIGGGNLALCTTKWVYEDQNSDIKGLLEMLDFPISAYYADFDFSLSSHPALKLYDDGEAKEGVGAGGALMYAILNGLTKEQITRQVESFLG